MQFISDFAMFADRSTANMRFMHKSIFPADSESVCHGKLCMFDAGGFVAQDQCTMHNENKSQART